MKSTTIIYCGENGDSAKALAMSLRDQGERVLLVSGLMAVEAQPCERVIVMPDIAGWRRKQIEAAYPGKVQSDAPSAHVTVSQTLTFTAPIEEVTPTVPKPSAKHKPKAA